MVFTERGRMKKIVFLVLVLALSACMPQPTIRDPHCARAEVIRVIRVTNDLVFGWTDVGADVNSYSPTKFYHPEDKHYVYLKREPHQIYYPGQIIHLPNSVCIKYAGSFSYFLDDSNGFSTLKGVIDTAEYPNPEYEKLMAERFEKAKTSPWVRRRLEQKYKKRGK